MSQGPQATSPLRQGEAQAVKKWLMKKPSSGRIKSLKKTVKTAQLYARRLRTLRSVGVKKNTEAVSPPLRNCDAMSRGLCWLVSLVNFPL